MRTFYHISRAESRQSILENGLVTGSRKAYGYEQGTYKREYKGYRNKLFLFREREKVSYGYVSHNGAMDLWEVKVPDGVRISQDPFAAKNPNCCIIGKAIPPENLKLLSTKWHPLEYEGSDGDPLP